MMRTKKSVPLAPRRSTTAAASCLSFQLPTDPGLSRLRRLRVLMQNLRVRVRSEPHARPGRSRPPRAQSAERTTLPAPSRGGDTTSDRQGCRCHTRPVLLQRMADDGAAAVIAGSCKLEPVAEQLEGLLNRLQSECKARVLLCNATTRRQTPARMS